MRAKFGRGPTVVSKKGSLKCISRLTLINIEGGPRYMPPGVSRGSPALHCLLIISVL